MLQYTPIDEIPKVHQRLRDGFTAGKLQSIQTRKQQIAQLAYMIEDNVERFADSMFHDLGKTPFETNWMETEYTRATLINTLNNVDKWVTPQTVPFDLNYYAMSPTVKHEPKGTVLIISAFNFPISLTIPHVAAAIAAGNTVVVKPSEAIEKTAALFAELIAKYMDPDVVTVVNGGIPETTALLELKWDHIMFTGSPKVATVIAAAAAKHITPLTLELGGKSPVIVDSSADMRLTARRVLWGKCCNAGQACIAPDYALVVREKEDEFIKALTEAHGEFYPEASQKPEPSSFKDLGRIVNRNHFLRVKQLLDNTKGNVVLGGQTDEATRFVAPTIVKDIKLDDILMQDEIFAPILPIIAVDSIDEAIGIVNSLDHALGTYVFAQSSSVHEKVFGNTKSGAYLANEVFMHSGLDKVPFGGIGRSGYGSHGGYHGFKAFSHERVRMSSPGWLDTRLLLGLRYPPYNDASVASAKLMWRKGGTIPYPRAGETRGWFGGWFTGWFGSSKAPASN